MIFVLRDDHGLALSTDSPEAVRTFDHTLSGYLKYRANTPQRLGALLKLDPELAMGHVLKGYLMMLGFNQTLAGAARASQSLAAKLAGAMNIREEAHLAALTHWLEGDVERTLRVWEEIFTEHPHDVLAFRLHHFMTFWLGKPGLVQRAVEAVLLRWNEGLPDYVTILAWRASRWPHNVDADRTTREHGVAIG